MELIIQRPVLLQPPELRVNDMQAGNSEKKGK